MNYFSCITFKYKNRSHIGNADYMAHIQLIFNSNAGSGRSYEARLRKWIAVSKHSLAEPIECDPNHVPIPSETEILAIAGGDGSIRKVLMALIAAGNRYLKHPIGIIPIGTANNIAHGLGIKGTLKSIIHNWEQGKTVSMDIGSIIQKKEKQDYFLEAAGYGIFPRLMKLMSKLEKGKNQRTTSKLHLALQHLRETIKKYKPFEATIQVDEKKFSGSFLLIEIMNTPRFGPQLELSVGVDCNDQILDICLVHEHQRELLLDFLQDCIEKTMSSPPFPTIKGKKTSVICQKGIDMHIDDVHTYTKHATPTHFGFIDNSFSFLV
ncbi:MULTISPECIES: diacylglycerol/lipid kinase family protein [Chitinophagaceae]